MEKEQKYQELETVKKTYACRDSKFLSYIKEINMRVMLPYINRSGQNKQCALELGCGGGESTRFLAPLFEHLVVRDGSKEFLEDARAKLTEFDNIEYQYGLFEEMEEIEKYDIIIANYIFEHVDSVEDILKVCYRALKTGGILFITVPNAQALSRQLAVKMGILEDVYALTENDVKHGHKRVFDRKSLQEYGEKSDFHIIGDGGLYIKEFADFQLKEMVDKEILGRDHFIGMSKLAEDYPEIAGSIYICLEK